MAGNCRGIGLSSEGSAPERDRTVEHLIGLHKGAFRLFDSATRFCDQLFDPRSDSRTRRLIAR